MTTMDVIRGITDKHAAIRLILENKFGAVEKIPAYKQEVVLEWAIKEEKKCMVHNELDTLADCCNWFTRTFTESYIEKIVEIFSKISEDSKRKVWDKIHGTYRVNKYPTVEYFSDMVAPYVDIVQVVSKKPEYYEKPTPDEKKEVAELLAYLNEDFFERVGKV